MKQIFSKTILAASIAGAVMVPGLAQADSLLAPLVVSDNVNGIQTYLFYKMRGSGVANAQMGVSSPIHYTFIRKRAAGGFAASWADLYNNRAAGCSVENTTGNGSPWDMIYQRASSSALPLAADNDVDGATLSLTANALTAGDASAPAGYPATLPFYGMWVIDDVQALNNPIFSGEGDSSGFAYIADLNTGDVLDYKLLNNHRSTASGQFGNGFISKTSVDHMWGPTIQAANAGGTVGPVTAGPTLSGGVVPGVLSQPSTMWYTAVTGNGMTSAAELDGGWNQAVNITQIDQTGAQSILPIFQVNAAIAAGPGVYDNDEQVISGRQDTPITCLGLYSPEEIQTASQALVTRNGGWKRSHIVPTTAATVNGAQATGAITYRFDNVAAYHTAAAGMPDWTMQIETSGHLNTGALGGHPNRPY